MGVYFSLTKTKKGAKTMSKKGSIIYQINKELLSKCRFGESRHEHKLDGDAYRYIFSYNTLNTYQKQLGYMVKWSKENNIKLKTLDDIEQHGNEWLKSCLDSGMSSWTVTTRRAALCKLLDVPYSHFDVKIPPRRRADIKRGRDKTKALKHFSESRNIEQVTFCRCTGLRLSELKKITGDRLFFDDDVPYLRVTEGTKGGKARIVELCGSKDEIELCIALCNNADSSKVFEHVKENANTHGYRAEYAQRVYDKYARDIDDINNRKEIYAYRNDRKNVKLDKIAMLKTSNCLGHNRIDIVAINYLNNFEKVA